jgi:nitrogen regulatory protein PII
MIIYNQAHTERVEYILDSLQIRGYTRWDDVRGRGSETGVPHLGTHTWPEMNTALLAIINEDKVDPLFEKIKRLDQINTEIGVKAVVWSVDQMI